MSITARRLVTATLLLLLAALLAACNRGPDVESDPRAALQQALVTLADYDGYELTFGFDADEAARAALVEEDMDEEGVDLLLGATLFQQYVPGEAEDRREDEAYVRVDVGGDPVFEMVALPDYETYLRVGLPEIMELVERHGDPDDQPDLSELEAEANQFGLGEAYEVLRDGRWFRLTGIEQLSNLALGMTGIQQPEQDRQAEIQESLLSAFRDSFEDLDVTYVGSEDVGERIRVAADAEVLRDMARNVLPTLARAAGADQFGEDPEALAEEVAQDIPDDAAVTLDAWLDGGDLRQIAFDLFAAMRQAGEDVPDGEFVVAATIQEFGGSIDAPSDAYRLDLFELFGRFMGGAFMGMGEAFESGEVEVPGAVEVPGQDDLFNGECIDEDDLALYFGELEEDERELALQELEGLTGRERC